ncbi:hypothetical protein ND00_19220 [Clostridium sp. L74]|nr:hypothetical protein ND00_19220 [Clostridium sp. L74]
MIKGKKIYYVKSVSKDTYYPRHPQTWAVNQGIAKYRWEPKFKFESV